MRRVHSHRCQFCCLVALAFAVLVLGSAGHSLAQTPQWIWADHQGAPAKPGEICYFRKPFNVGFDVRQATLTAVGDDRITVYVNGKEVAKSASWKSPSTVDISQVVHLGKNIIAARGENGDTSPAAILVRIEVRSPNMSGQFVVTDPSWVTSAAGPANWTAGDFDASNWTRAASLGSLGAPPWGNVLKPPQATPAESLALLPGFKAELLHSALPEEGSWIAMCTDDKGRLIISPEKDEAPLLRVTLSPEGSIKKIETIPARVRAAMGLVYAYDSLYLNGHGPKGVGLYRLVDRNHNDQFDPGEEQLLKNFDGDNEHGYHAVVLGPDGMIYVMNGNHTKVPAGVAPNSPHQNYAEDLLLPRQWDANGHAKGVLAPGGYILRTDRDGKEWELVCGGFRNTYDFDFNSDAEIFTFDSDMEWDIGCPWYRPTRILHCVRGGEYGWRSGTGKWPVYFPDSLPSAVDVGLSSPTAVKFGAKSNFPEKYRGALFAADWAYGKIFAVHLRPSGASYQATFETFVSGQPLAVTAISFGADGAMYFIIGGWKIQSGLYRITYHADLDPKKDAALAVASLAIDTADTAAAAEARAIRRKIESYYAKKDPAAVNFVWPYLSSNDRWLRYAARLALEYQDLKEWQERALAERQTDASLSALLALTRAGTPGIQNALLTSLDALENQPLTESQALEALRVLQLAFIRFGRPDADMSSACIDVLSKFYPAASPYLNRELCQVLAYLNAPDVVSKTLALLAAAPTQQDQMHYAFVLRTVSTGWTLDQRRAYFSWFNKALREYQGGASFKPYLINIRNEAAATLTPSERQALAPILEEKALPSPAPLAQKPFIKEWTLADLEPFLGNAGHAGSVAKGKEAFAAAHCVLCHRVNADGGAIGPDLTGVSGRFNQRDLLENILQPSKIISDRYQSYIVTTTDGDEVSGCITEETDEKLVVIVNPMTDQRREIFKKKIESRVVSKVSAMPEGLLNVLTRDEILDLLAFLQSTKPQGVPAAPAAAGQH